MISVVWLFEKLLPVRPRLCCVLLLLPGQLWHLPASNSGRDACKICSICLRSATIQQHWLCQYSRSLQHWLNGESSRHCQRVTGGSLCWRSRYGATWMLLQLPAVHIPAEMALVPQHRISASSDPMQSNCCGSKTGLSSPIASKATKTCYGGHTSWQPFTG